ncbi:BNR repeat-containing protein [Planococcus donghaensis MPA1U2]|uniref:BNR repeat-containing protein n=1 Tax=Planococcus donghaensis MPA1U2 TaxID=933115 RepID=E7RKR7_9BACL|nr:hypothetical protein [Planococcus donghaensis]EGA88497.1 BNR repeat-containing protein [Planococcus donghaensis MPA1U2]
MKTRWILTPLMTGLLLVGCAPSEESDTSTAETDDNSEELVVAFDGRLDHVHGMGYIENEKGLYFASHNGLRIYRYGEWLEATEHANDYMGFNTVADGFYTSGHPGPNSMMQNPIGIQRSIDGGRSLDHLGFEGETDFHHMAVGYRSHHLFVMNPQENSQLNAGYFRSENDGEEWQQVNGSGLAGEVSAFAMHPSDSQLIAAASAEGVFLSKDGGDSFSSLTENGVFGTAVFFNEESLYYATYDSQAELINYTLETANTQSIELPDLPEDGVIFIAQNPLQEEQLAIYTAAGHAFTFEEGNWKQILNAGQIEQ